MVFLSCLRQFSEQGSHWAEVISEIRMRLETLLDQSVDFDVLPAFDSLSQLRPGSRPDPQVYKDLIHSYSNAGEFSTSFTELQHDFISTRPTKLKSLIQLVKQWYQQCNKMVQGKGSLPPQHGLELLTVYAWEQGSQNSQFNMAEGFHTVLELVGQRIILGPADPIGNLGSNACWDLLAQEAAASTSALCCMDKDRTPIKLWLVKV
ncbi:2'-5'-oligoadenylate synthase 3-like [Chionomys nivalis]|uniref:2'-5'-oligoadenylate synthase 3-like n=1 Tax=Chionomys nivalis TaxID=269649 RepID=UPI00259A4524|nr:2'-5'-oligoadenylate synthase 3-like [Chionomys nivalis]